MLSNIIVKGDSIMGKKKDDSYTVARDRAVKEALRRSLKIIDEVIDPAKDINEGTKLLASIHLVNVLLDIDLDELSPDKEDKSFEEEDDFDVDEDGPEF